MNAQLRLQEEEVRSVQYWSKDEIMDRIDWQKKHKELFDEAPQPGEIAPCSLAAFEYLRNLKYF